MSGQRFSFFLHFFFRRREITQVMYSPRELLRIRGYLLRRLLESRAQSKSVLQSTISVVHIYKCKTHYTYVSDAPLDSRGLISRRYRCVAKKKYILIYTRVKWKILGENTSAPSATSAAGVLLLHCYTKVGGGGHPFGYRTPGEAQALRGLTRGICKFDAGPAECRDSAESSTIT